MASLLVTGIGELVTNDPTRARAGDPPDVARLGVVRDAAVIVDDDRVAWVGPRAELDGTGGADRRLDVAGSAVIPGFVDAHAHLVFAGDRSAEFAARMTGYAYSAGGIVTTVTATRAATDEVLRANVSRLVGEMARQGTTTVEIKSGYGLTVPDEARSLRLAGELTTETTYLGAHVVPPEFREDVAGYVDLVCGPMLGACAPHARWVDVFCERGGFDADAARAVLRAGQDRGLLARVHANQLGPGPGVQVAAELGAVSADHCTHLAAADVAALAGAGVVATLLPGAELSTRSPYPDARSLLQAGVTVALATDCNPGSSFTSSMPLCVALAVTAMRMSPAEAMWSATAGGAASLRRTDIGWAGVGAVADLAVLDAPSYLHLAYRPGVPLVRGVVRGGRLLDERQPLAATALGNDPEEWR